jgi:hypothetical protein
VVGTFADLIPAQLEHVVILSWPSPWVRNADVFVERLPATAEHLLDDRTG